MKVYKIECILVDWNDDFEQNGKDEIIDILDNYEGPNHSMSFLEVLNIDSVDIGEADDDHPLNKIGSRKEEINRIFKEIKTEEWNNG